ncbi:MAG: hypothetical protein PVI57_14910 [Gemmatimonadota bacterium]
MTISEAQAEIRSAFLGGFVGQLVSAVLWAVAAALGTWGRPGPAMVFLVVGGFFIFPLTQLGLRVIGRPGRVGPRNSLNSLGAQVAFVLPLCLPVVGAATLHRTDWFFPAFMVVLGAHYLPFAFLYGMRMFLVLAAVLWLAGCALGLWIPAPFATGAWSTAAVLIVFAVAGRRIALAAERPGPEAGAAMLLRVRTLEAIRDGQVTVAFRRWRRPTVRSGGTLRDGLPALAEGPGDPGVPGPLRSGGRGGLPFPPRDPRPLLRHGPGAPGRGATRGADRRSARRVRPGLGSGG